MDSIKGGLFSKGASTHRVQHTEFVSDISGTTGFAVRTVPINPGQSSLFPWLSSIAARYEKYRFRSLRFIYETNKSTATNGVVVLAVDYDAEDDVPATKSQLLQNEDKERGAPWQKFHMQCSEHNLRKSLGMFVRPGAVPSGVDVKTYDLGQLFIGTNGMADTSVVGELYVEYDIELETPVLEESGLAANHSIYSVMQFNKISPLLGGPNQIPFDREWLNPDPTYYKNDGAGNLTLPPGAYLVTGWANLGFSSAAINGQMLVDFRQNNFSIVTGGGASQPGFNMYIASTDTGALTVPFIYGIVTKEGDSISVYVTVSGTVTNPSVEGIWMTVTAV